MTQKWSKWFARASCALVTCVAMSVTVSAAGGYSDVDEGDWFWNAVSYVTDNNLMDGRNGKFEPNADLTRADLAVALYRMAGSPEISGSMPFSDVSSDASCQDAVLWAYKNEVITGIKNDSTEQLTFAPNGSIRRQDVAVMLQRYANGTLPPEINSNGNL